MQVSQAKPSLSCKPKTTAEWINLCLAAWQPGPLFMLTKRTFNKFITLAIYDTGKQTPTRTHTRQAAHCIALMQCLTLRIRPIHLWTIKFMAIEACFYVWTRRTALFIVTLHFSLTFLRYFQIELVYVCVCITPWIVVGWRLWMAACYKSLFYCCCAYRTQKGSTNQCIKVTDNVKTNKCQSIFFLPLTWNNFWVRCVNKELAINFILF